MDDKSDTKRVLSHIMWGGPSVGAMRHIRQLLPMLIMMFALPLMAQDEAFPIDENFEESTLPDGWAVETVKGEHKWEFRSEEGNSFMELRNPGEQSLGFESMLITPVIDLSDFMEPVVIFSYRMDKWAGGCDSLVVMYRTSTDGEWNPIETDAIGRYASVWTQDTVYGLPLGNETYQLAFRGIDRLGRGIQIDNVVVRECPACDRPAVTVTGVGKTEASLIWTSGGLDATAYRVRINSSAMSDRLLNDPDYKADILDSVITNVSNRFLQLKGLSLGQDHYVYVRTLCGRDSSAYSMEQKFTTLNTQEIDYYEDFNMPLTGISSQLQTWYTFNSEDKICPFVNTSLSGEGLASYSPDKSTALVFGDAQNATYITTMPAGTMCCAITPELTGVPLTECQVRFTVKAMSAYGSSIPTVYVYAGAEPKDIKTKEEFYERFTLAGSAHVLDREGFKEVIIPLSGMPDTARHIAFVADSENKQGFSIDNMYIEKIPVCAKAFDVKVSIPSSTEISVSWNTLGATDGEVMLTSEVIKDLGKIDESKVIKRAGGKLPVKLEGLDPWTEGYVYVRNTCGADGNGEWSVPVFVRMPERMAEMPVYYDFERGETYATEASGGGYDLLKGLTVLALEDKSTVRIGRPNKQHLASSANCIYTQATAEEYLIFPEMTDVENTRVVLWHTAYADNSSFEVGLMSDINDTASFTRLLIVNSERYSAGGWKRTAVDLRGHSDKGKFFAVKYLPTSGTHWIDDVEFKKMPDCAEPTNVEIVPSAEEATITWEANGTAKWEVCVCDADAYDNLPDASYGRWIMRETVETPTVTVSGLKAGEFKYFFFIKPVCDGEATEWMAGIPFRTTCKEITTLPYVEDFSKYQDILGVYSSQTLPCYTIYANRDGSEYSGGSPLWSSSYGRGDNLLLQNDTVSYPSYRNGYFIFPKMDVDIKELMLSMDVEGQTKGNGYFEVGVVASPEDTANFVAVDKVRVNDGQKSNVQVYFSKYTGEGQHIAFRASGGMQYKLAVSNINISTKGNCAKVKSLAAEEVTGTTAKLSWSGDMETSWDLIVSTKAMSTERLNAAFESGKTNDTVTFIAKGITENPYQLEEGIFYSTFYYFYVRAICSETVKGEWSDPGTFRTECGILSVDEMHVEDFENYDEDVTLDCWSAGNYMEEGSLGSTKLNIPGVAVGTSHSGSNSILLPAIRHDATKFDNGSYMITPEIKTDKMNGLQVSFWGYAEYDRTGASLGRVRVGVVTSEEDPATFVEAEVLHSYGQWYHYTILFDRYEGDMNGQQGKRVMFMADFPIESYFYIDDLEFNEIPACAAPAHVTLDSLGSDYTRITWAKGSAPYTIRLSETQLSYEELATLTEDEEKGLVSFENVTDTFIELKDLEKRTEYFAYIGSECGDTMLWSNLLSFETACEVEYPLPYVYDFEDAPFTGYYSGPDCWENFYGEERIWFQKCNISGNGRNGGQALDMVISNVQYTSYAVMPKMARPVNETLVSFYAEKASGNAVQTNVVVGVVSDVTSRETMKNSFVPVDTVIITKEGWNKYYVPMGSYTGKGEYIAFSGAFRLSLDGADKMCSSTYYLDDVTVDSLPSCMFPEYLTVDSVSSTDIKVSFTELGDAKEWQVACVKAGEELTGTTEAKGSTATTYVINGLEPLTDYDIYVRSVCDAPGGNVSPWTGPVTQRTAAPAAVGADAFPYDEPFESGTGDTWSFSGTEGRNVWTTGTSLHNGDGTNSMYISNDGTSATLKSFTGVMGGKEMLGGSEGTTWQSVSDFTIIENDMAGYYHLVLMWENEATEEGGTVTPSAAIDNLKIERSSCVQPLNLYIGRVSSADADLSWEIVGDKSEYKEWEAYVTADMALQSLDDDTDGSKKVFGGKFTDIKGVIENLAELTQYKAFVRAVCTSDGSNTIWSEPVTFTTPCNPVLVGTVFDFEDDDDACITFGSAKHGTLGETGAPTIKVESNRSNSYIAFSGTNAAYINSRYSGQEGYYMALPHIEGSLDNVQLTFWMRPIPHRNNGVLGLNAIVGSGLSNSASSVMVAAISDMKDTTTMSAIAECVYPYTDEDINKSTLISDDITGNDWWVKFSVPLKGHDGERILLLDERTNKIDNYLYIDSIAVEPVPTCVMPTNVTIGRTTDETVEFSFDAEGEGTWRYRCSTDPYMTDAITADITTADGKVEGLKPATTYYLSVCRVCGDKTSEWTLNKRFTTNHSVRFEERFTDVTNVPSGWTRAYEPTAETLFDIPESEWRYHDDSNMEGWIYSDVTNEASAHQKIKLTAGKSKPYWLITPAIYLREGQEAYMTFDLMLTLADSYEALGADVERTATTFMMLISDDGGKTWLENNATVWDAGSGTNDLANFYDLTNVFKTITVDLSAYKGKSIKVAFYVLPTVPVDLDLHLDNLYINSYETIEVPDDICEECDYAYEAEDIVIPSEEYDIEAAQNVFEVFRVSEDGGSDKQYKFILNVKKMGRSEFTEEICAGSTYDGHGFTGVTTAGEHWRKLPSVNGCDSLVTLNLVVNPLNAKEFETTMCAGGKYEWNGNTYTTAGDYTDTVSALGDGCDTIVTLHLTTIPAMEGERTHYLCDGESVMIDGQTFTSDGSWAEEIVEERKPSTEEGVCDSVITHTVIYAQKYDYVIEAAICDGETYNKNGFTVQAENTYPKKEVSKLTGCDSLVTLNLLVIKEGETEREVTRDITVDLLPYSFYGEEYDESTAPGQYTGEVTVTAESGACSMKVKYTLNVGDIEQGTENVSAIKELLLTPNPVRVHETVIVHLDFTAAEREGLTVSVYNSTGTLVDTFEPTSEPVVIGGLDAVGVYLVRVVDGLGQVYQGKIIVR